MAPYSNGVAVEQQYEVTKLYPEMQAEQAFAADEVHV